MTQASRGMRRRIGRAVAGALVVGGLPLASVALAPGAVATESVVYHADGTANSDSGLHNGTWSGTARYASGASGSAGDQSFQFIGDNSRITMDTAVGTFRTAPFAISFSMRTTSTQPMSIMSARQFCGGPPQGWWDIRAGGGSPHIEVAGSGTYAVISANTNIADGAWHDLDITRSGTSLKFYVDGVLKSSSTVSTTADVNPGVPFGINNSPCRFADPTRNMIGDLDDVAISATLPADTDGDGVLDSHDPCPTDATNIDSDGDGACDSDDPCPTDAADADSDGDGTCDVDDPCPADADNDADGDGVCGDVDACPADADNDADGDGVCGDVDPCPADADNDADGDGVCGDVDPCPASPLNDGDGDGTCDTPAPVSKDQCKNDGWRTFNNPSFRNQGQCVSSVVSNRR